MTPLAQSARELQNLLANTGDIGWRQGIRYEQNSHLGPRRGTVAQAPANRSYAATLSGPEASFSASSGSHAIISFASRRARSIHC